MTAPDAPQEIVIGFEEGTPVSLDGQELPLHELVLAIGTVAGAHGVGRIDMIEDRLVGIKSREVYEAPGAITLYAAQQALESLVLERDLRAVKAELSLKYATLVYNGLWFSPLRAALDAFVRTSRSALTGEVRLRLFKGHLQVVGRRAPASLYDHGLATYEEGDAFDHSAAAGFIHIFSLPTRTWAAGRSSGAPVR